jgi:NAD(P)-dependent dehydrogenase (short-subunit alcohol dehydrogenase family)
MNCLIIGGTGFLGYHAALELLRRGQRVSVLALPPLPAEDLLPSAVRVILADLNALADVELLAPTTAARPAVRPMTSSTTPMCGRSCASSPWRAPRGSGAVSCSVPPSPTLTGY